MEKSTQQDADFFRKGCPPKNTMKGGQMAYKGDLKSYRRVVNYLRRLSVCPPKDKDLIAQRTGDKGGL